MRGHGSYQNIFVVYNKHVLGKFITANMSTENVSCDEKKGFQLCKVPRTFGKNMLRAQMPFTTGGFLKRIWSGGVCSKTYCRLKIPVLPIQVPDDTFIERQPQQVIVPAHSPNAWVPWKPGHQTDRTWKALSCPKFHFNTLNWDQCVNILA